MWRDRADRIVTVALATALAWFALQAAALAVFKYFTIDEFQYAHAAWLVAQGQVPYRDFFEVHFPLLYQLLAPAFLVLGDDPVAVVALRAAMLGFVALAAVAAACVNRAEGRLAALLAPVFLLALPPFVTFATEIRPDSAAFALFLAAIGALRLPRLSDRACGFLAGCLLVSAVWASQKALFYASIFLPALVLDLRTAGRQVSTRRLVRDPAWFLLGTATGLAAIAAYLTATTSWSAWWSWCITWAAEHQRHYPGFSWRRYFGPNVAEDAWVFALAAVGLATTIRRLVRSGSSAWSDADLLLVAAVPTTFASFALQRAPFPYSLLPFLGVAALLAARGAAPLLASSARAVRTGAALVLLVLLARQGATLARWLQESNAGQLAVLARVGELTAPTDVVYDNSGGYVARPHAYFYFYTDKYLRIADRLARDVPAALVDSGCVLQLADARRAELPISVRRFLFRHYQPLDGDVALWGRRYRVPESGRLEDVFLAVRGDRYFVDPENATEQGELRVDGRPVRDRVFWLAKGEHTITYTGPPGTLHVLWLPRDGKRWQPRWNVRSTFSRVL